jgi:propanol-preferring alcohol dehydrogenase
VAPLLCAGIIGFRSLRVAGVQPGDRVGLFGFGSSATLSIPILQSWGCNVYVVTRGQAHRATANKLGATWVGDENAKVPVSLDRAITFAPSGKVVVDYYKLLWGDRPNRSDANMTRADASDFLALAHRLHIQPRVSVFPLDRANDALLAVKNETEDGSAVIVP